MRYMLLALALAACDGGGSQPRPPSGVVWTIGPIIDGKNYSRGTPLYAATEPDGFSIPIGPTQEPHYVTFNHGPLTGKSAIRMTYRVEGDGVIYGKDCSPSPSAVTLYFQRRGDDWSTDGNRWWATFATVPLSGPGTFAVEASLNGPWTSVNTETAIGNPGHFARAKDEASEVGFTFGNCTGFGHGARATAPVKFTVTEFEVI